jgi:hypothetical protein
MENDQISHCSNKGFIKGENERGPFMGVSNLTTKKNWTGKDESYCWGLSNTRGIQWTQQRCKYLEQLEVVSSHVVTQCSKTTDD